MLELFGSIHFDLKYVFDALSDADVFVDLPLDVEEDFLEGLKVDGCLILFFLLRRHAEFCHFL